MKTRLVIALIAAIASASAAADIVDQRNDGVFGGGFDISASPIGESFVPALDELDFVDLLINDQNPGFGTAVDVAVRIRSNDIGGSILGTSDTVSFHDQVPMAFQLPEVVRFLFPTAVSLTSGQTYVIEPIKLGGLSDLGIFGTGFNNDAYAPGVSFFMGAVLTDPDLAPFDLWFREGLAAPEPGTPLLLLAGVGLLLVRCKRKATRG